MVVEVAWALVGLAGLYCGFCCLNTVVCPSEQEAEATAGRPWLEGVVGTGATPPAPPPTASGGRSDAGSTAASASSVAAPTGRCEHLRGIEPPSRFLCPITMDIMSDPVTCVDGHHTFDRSSLKRALALRGECPVSRVPMRPGHMRPNAALDCEIVRWIAHLKHVHPDLAISIPPHKQVYLSHTFHDNASLSLHSSPASAPLQLPPARGDASARAAARFSSAPVLTAMAVPDRDGHHLRRIQTVPG